MLDTAIFDVDGTLVDSTYLHVLAWSRAFASVDVAVPGWRLHQHMGMGGDQLVAAVAGDDVEHRLGDEVRERWRRGYTELLDDLRPLPGAVTTLEACRDAGLAVVLATSGEPEHVDRSLEALGITRAEFPLVSSDDVDATKPAPDLIEHALDEVRGNTAVLVGDTVWDVQAGDRAGVPCVGVLTGGASRAALHEAGALRVYDGVAAVRDALPDLLAVFGPAPAAIRR